MRHRLPNGIETLIRFMYNYHLLQITGKPLWLTTEGGRWGVWGGVEEHLFVLYFVTVKHLLNCYSSGCPPRTGNYISRDACARGLVKRRERDPGDGLGEV
jgi:hypothetical protein